MFVRQTHEVVKKTAIAAAAWQVVIREDGASDDYVIDDPRIIETLGNSITVTGDVKQEGSTSTVDSVIEITFVPFDSDSNPVTVQVSQDWFAFYDGSTRFETTLDSSGLYERLLNRAFDFEDDRNRVVLNIGARPGAAPVILAERKSRSQRPDVPLQRRDGPPVIDRRRGLPVQRKQLERRSAPVAEGRHRHSKPEDE